ncbi:hypothetical protein [Methylorubrum sp. GM97]|uniref:hypothetical protein n=1 Tax=Methylorubrum sp. GM97 TaxID=2938232 RepID=UPI0021862A7A|nr:hypothetical protein [Methylorubrum sp. GM97]BDL39008.1 hypothetical protein MSPGM_15980 [Methylorubrum sp. GM97]
MGRANQFFIVVPVNPETHPTDCPSTRALAAKVRAGMHEGQVSDEAIRFLDFVAAGKGVECGRKGQLLTWGYVSNYGKASQTAEELRPFWEGLWRLDDEGPLSHETALVVSQDEEGMPVAVQVGIDDEAFWDGRIEVRMRVSELPVGLMGGL